MTTAHHPTIRDTLAALRAKHARNIAPPVQWMDVPPVQTQPATSQTSRTRSRNSWRNEIYRMVVRHGPSTAEQLAALVGSSTRVTRISIRRMFVAGLLVVVGKTSTAQRGRHAHVYDLADRGVSSLTTPPPRWIASLMRLAEDRQIITFRDVMDMPPNVTRQVANRRLRELTKLGLLEVAELLTGKPGAPQKSYRPAGRVA